MAPDQPRRRADAERNTETILAAARGFLAQGTLPSMSEVSTASGVGRVTLYKHFATREVLLEAVVRRAIADTDDALSELSLDTGPVEDALKRLVRTSWPILDRHRKVRTVALTAIGHEALRAHHDPAFRHVDQLIARGQDTGAFRSDLSRAWLTAVFYAILHAAADEVDAGRLTSDAAADSLIQTLLATLRPARQRPTPKSS
ncbi:TetR/AcrR family transcriptional regulator [Kribbella albertanoniae]|uniref:TetR/AcrR family transcriptional regulator n=1 Tax=Kribbella albertanoniae TaxID=1266829 RepID=A0A4V2XST7_9ACTN|nr:TetR/AcrR family transcriptional regulator [Kribbella albertanoniae]TDC34995.1 TetR/AcrR family transcriptional regulator [Kribbella albertanoniae]